MQTDMVTTKDPFIEMIADIYAKEDAKKFANRLRLVANNVETYSNGKDLKEWGEMIIDYARN